MIHGRNRSGPYIFKLIILNYWNFSLKWNNAIPAYEIHVCEQMRKIKFIDDLSVRSL